MEKLSNSTVNDKTHIEKLRPLKLWLEELPPDIYNRAIANNLKQGYESRLDYTFVSGDVALICCFDFNHSIEGSQYWDKVIEIYF